MLRQVLLEYLQASRVVNWPGADGLAVDDIISCYPEAIAAGEVPNWHELQNRFPQMADALQALRSAKAWLDSTPSHNSQQYGRSQYVEPPLEYPQGLLPMALSEGECGQHAESADHCRLCRWLVYFSSGTDWYPVGEFLALEAPAAIERAIEVFGPGAGYQAEEIPWDAAPLSRANLSAVQD